MKTLVKIVFIIIVSMMLLVQPSFSAKAITNRIELKEALKEAKSTWDNEIYGAGSGNLITTINVTNKDTLTSEETIKNAFKNATYSPDSIKSDIMKKRVREKLLEKRKELDKSPTTLKTVNISVPGITYITKASVEELSSNEQKQWSEVLEEFQTRVKNLEKYASKYSSQFNPMTGGTTPDRQVTKYIDQLKENAETAKKIKKWIDVAIEDGKNADAIYNEKDPITGETPTVNLDDEEISMGDADDQYIDDPSYDYTGDAPVVEEVNPHILPERDLGYVNKDLEVGDMSIDGTMEQADDFAQAGDETKSHIDETKLQGSVKSMYNILLAVAMVIAIGVGVVISIKLITGSVEEQAKMKELFVPYIFGCIVAFGAFGIWSLVMNIMNNL